MILKIRSIIVEDRPYGVVDYVDHEGKLITFRSFFDLPEQGKGSIEYWTTEDETHVAFKTQNNQN